MNTKSHKTKSYDKTKTKSHDETKSHDKDSIKLYPNDTKPKSGGNLKPSRAKQAGGRSKKSRLEWSRSEPEE